MSKQDVNAVRTAQDLEIKYDLSNLAGLKKNYELQKQGLTKVENELNDFVKVTTKDIEEIKNQVDGNVTTWFSSGIPTLENFPTNEWITDTEKNNHLGDLYYDQDTGYAYRFIQKDGIFSWLRITDSDVTEALAIANAAKDTADRKRQVFVVQPKPPYDVGDLWIRDEEIYRCQTSRPDGEIFEDNDWIKATKYTDDTVANQVDGKLTILSGTVTEIKENVDELKTTMTNTTKVVDEQGNTIGILQEKQSETTQTVNGITTRVSTVENSLSTTNSNLTNLSDKVNTLSNDIDGVSADFEEFKDNEYIQSIDNLQKQIDGAIQFWNGAEIPTVNNYPANGWTTENDKINHQADIYTVVQDVQGEMKQGKSYRFDKVNGVWQWIELTDNELSAVQALAQEALEKANKNATEIGTVKTRISSLEQTDEQIKASVESIDKQIIPTANISGSNIYVEDASDNPLVKLEIEGKSKQETRSGKNNFDEEKAKKSSNYTANTSIGSNWYTITIDLLPNTEYTITRFANNVSTNGAFNLQFYLYEDTKNPLFYVNNATAETVLNKKTLTFTTRESGKIYLATLYGNDTRLTNLFNNIDIQIEKGNVSTEYEQYGVSPSPDHPSEIESVGYTNLFDKNDNIIEGKYIGNDGSYGSDAHSFYQETYIRVKPNTSYVISSSEKIDYRIVEYTKDKSFIKRNSANNLSYTITTSSQTEYVRLSCSIKALDNIQLIEGSVVHSYIPYGKYGIEITNIGKNLFDYVTNIRGTVNGITSTINSDGSITVTGIPTVDYAGVVGTTNIDNLLENGQQYTISQSVITDSKVYIEVRAKNRTTNAYTYYSIASGSKSKTFTVDKLTYSYNIYIVTTTVSKWGTESLTITNTYQLEKGSTATEFNKYQKITSTMVLNAPSRSLPNGVKDIAYIRNNKLYVDRYVGSVVFDGSENWIVETAYDGYARFKINDFFKETIIKNTGMNNHFKQRISEAHGDYEYLYIQPYSKSIYIQILPSRLNENSVNGFKTWLSTNNVKVDYELVTPVTEELGEIQIPSTFKGVNHISTTDDLEPTLNIEYVRDTTLSNYVEGQIDKVMTIQNRKIAELIVQDDEITQRVSATETNLNNNYMTSDQVTAQTDSLSKEIATTNTKVTELKTTIDGVNINIQSLSAKIVDMNFSFQTDALSISTSASKINSKFNNTGVKVYNYDKLMAIFNHKGTGVGDLIVTGTAQIGYLKFMKSTKNGKPITAIHQIISEIQTLEDLESDE